MNPSERSMTMRFAAHKSWANTTDRSARTAPARRASNKRFLEQAREQHPDATDAQIEQIAESLSKAYFTELSLKSAQARRIRASKQRPAA